MHVNVAGIVGDVEGDCARLVVETEDAFDAVRRIFPFGPVKLFSFGVPHINVEERRLTFRATRHHMDTTKASTMPDSAKPRALITQHVRPLSSDQIAGEDARLRAVCLWQSWADFAANDLQNR